ncbi:MAG: sugar phosphate nucleotidyltransferase [Elusimicrobiota bacterium]|jgi:NDP-sugar pyrophosphorylase family protein
MQAVILAGGKGTRLRPFTTSLPKPLVPVGDKPILEILLRRLKRQGFREIIISTGHLAELIEAYFGNGKRWGLRIRYVREDKPLHTAGALRLIRGLAPHFLVINGDILTDMDFKDLVRAHLRAKAWATLAVTQRESRVDYGVIRTQPDGCLSEYIEKPAYQYLVSMGINVFNRRAVNLIKPGEALGIPELALRLKAAGRKVFCKRSSDQWLDIGRPDDYEAAQTLVEKNTL